MNRYDVMKSNLFLKAVGQKTVIELGCDFCLPKDRRL